MSLGKAARFPSDIPGTVVAQPFCRAREFSDLAEPIAHRLNHHVTNELTAGAACRRSEGDYLSIAAVQAKGDSNAFVTVTGDFKTIRAVPLVAARHRHGAVMDAHRRRVARVSLQQQMVLVGEPINSLGIDRRKVVFAPGPAQEGPQPSVAIRGLIDAMSTSCFKTVGSLFGARPRRSFLEPRVRRSTTLLRETPSTRQTSAVG